MNTVELQCALAKIDRPKILVIGDIISDIYIDGMISRISREAPVLILEQQTQRTVLGGAANAAHNLATLAGEVYLAGIIGLDSVGREMLELLSAKGINSQWIYQSRVLPTCTKTRILAAAEHGVRQQMLRVDRTPQGELEGEGWSFFQERLFAAIQVVDGIHISDYGLPLLSGLFRQELLDMATQAHKLVLVDSHQIAGYQGATIVTPNLEEASRFVGYSIRNLSQLEDAGREILTSLHCQAVLITRGPEGMSLFLPDGAIHHLPVYNKSEVVDVSGAGDTVASMMILGLTSGLDFLTAASLANIAAGIVVRKMGTATLNRDELRMELGFPQTKAAVEHADLSR
ncbi:bifunctional heptose 7-phosphate kinase/heptose 1-phosphate adenyltransferase [Hydrogenispora ethanolica]|uniref:bifunctional heptose 7-phosphate kinase/heptose 1-phosphate adenyltransferase n=1 Tax=Hydrogenispora ethanolica TaxID=1082276 RepID=UPI001A9EF5F0|nr:PfkB family carbohydrate kinase [Hydrogenispora ethanolica]